MEDNELQQWIVRSGDSYLCPNGGDVGYTTSLAEAGKFGSEAEAMEAARDHCDPGFVVMPFPSVDDRLRETLKALEDFIPDEHAAPRTFNAIEPQHALPPAAPPSKSPAGPISFLAFSKASRHLVRKKDGAGN